MRVFKTIIAALVAFTFSVPTTSSQAAKKPRHEAAARAQRQEQAQERPSVALYYNRAQYAIKRKMYAEALEAIDEGVKIDPAYLPFLWQRALVLTRLKRHDEAERVIALAIVAMPDNVELGTLAVENITALYERDPAKMHSMLVAHFRRVDPRIMPALVYELTRNYSRPGSAFQQIFRALEESGALEGNDRRILAAYMAKKPEQAASMLAASLERSQGGRNLLLASLCLLTAEDLQKKSKIAEAEELYKKAIALGYNREKAMASRARIFMDLKMPARAAEVYAGQWRGSSEPAVWAVKAAGSYQASGHGAEALAVLREALEVVPHDPYLLGQYYFYLDMSGKTAQLDQLASSMETSRQFLALYYGKYLSASRKGNTTAVYAAKENIFKNAEQITSVHEQAGVRLIMDDLGMSGPASPLERQTNMLRTTGWELWNQGRYGEAFIYWRDSIYADPERNRTSGANMSSLLVQQNMIPQALEIFRKQFPELSPLSLGLMLMRNEQWFAVEPLLATIPAQGGQLEVWRALGLAYGSLKNGSEQSIEPSAKKLLALDPPSGTQTVMIPDQQHGLSALTLDRGYYLKLLKDYVSELFRQGRSNLFASVLSSRQLKAIPPAEGAVMFSDAAFVLAARGETDTAIPLWRAALDMNPNLPEANLGMALVEKMQGNDEASNRYLQAGLAGDSLKKEYILGRINMLDGKNEEAAAHFAAYLRMEPKNFSACFELFHLYMAMPNYAKARALRAHFEKYSSLPEARMYLAQCNLDLGYYKTAEKMFRAMLKTNPGHRPAVLGLVRTLRAQDRYEEAAAVLAAYNLDDPEVLAVLRKKAEQAMREQKNIQAREYASEYLNRSPDSPYVNDIYNSSFREEYRQENERLQRLKRDRIKLDKGKLDRDSISPERLAELQQLDPKKFDELKPDDTPLVKAEEHAGGILQRNPIQRNALESILDIALQRENFKEAAHLSRDMAAEFPQDPYYALQSTVHMGAISRFDYSFPIVEKMADRGANASAAVVCFANISALPRDDAYTARDIDYNLEVFQERYNIVSSGEILAWSGSDKNRYEAEKIPMMIIMGHAAPAELADIDAILKRRKIRAALLVSEESFLPGTPENMPNVAELRRLAATGRWEFILTDTVPRSIVKATSGRKGNFWAERGLVNGQPETVEQMRNRWSRMISSIQAKVRAQGFDLHAWMYPGGDYGQLGLDGGHEIRQAYGEAVKEHFSMSFAPTGTGYHLDCADPMFVPVRNIYFPLDEKALTAMPEVHPSRLAVMDEALLASWHGQMPRAERLFERASHFGLSAKDLAYYRANNAIYDGDASYANKLARAARALDPEALRTEIQTERAERMLRPRISFVPRWWNDDAEREYSEYTLTFSGHVHEDLSLSAFVSDVTWGHDGKYVNGQAGGVGLRYYPFKQHWIDLMVRGVQPSDGSDGFAEWRAAWRGVYATDFLKINGTYNLVYSRESIETRESIEKGIYADRLALNTDMRILNWGVLEGEIYGINRTDGNTTRGLTLSPRYIVWDKPHLRVGYLFGMADSDRNPPEYYAPQEYINHMAVVSGEYELFKNFSLRGMLGYGMAKSKNKDWQQVLRYNGGFNWNYNEDLSLQGGYQRLELPDYTLDQYTLGISYIF